MAARARLGSEELVKIAKGAVIAALGAVGAYLVTLTPVLDGVEIAPVTATVVAVGGIVINAVYQFFRDL